MDEFNAVPFLIGLVVAALLGLASGRLASAVAGSRPLSTNPVTDGGAWSAVLFWLGFVIAAVSGISFISVGGFWGRNALNIAIVAIAAVDVVYSARAVRVWHNRTRVARTRPQ